jgi:putative flavoprotein involved in K+ transport
MQEERSRDPSGEELLDVVVVGGSQAGLAMAWHLKQRGLRFVVLEAGARLGQVWRSRWDSLKLLTPAEYNVLPGMPFLGPANTYPTKEPVADYLEVYVKVFNLRRTEDGVFEVPNRRPDLSRPPGGGGDGARSRFLSSPR